MSEKKKRLIINIIFILIYLGCAIYSLSNAFGSWPVVYMVDMGLSIMWLTGVVLWSIRTVRMYKQM